METVHHLGSWSIRKIIRLERERKWLVFIKREFVLLALMETYIKGNRESYGMCWIIERIKWLGKI